MSRPMTALLQDNKVDVIQQIAEAAVLAPSAENLQPWSLIKSGDSLAVCLDMSRTFASDVNHMLSLTAIGACIENAVLAATTFGLKGNVQIVANSIPLRSNAPSVPIAEIKFKGEAPRDPLASCIQSRCTSRRMNRRPVANSLLDEIEQSCDRFPRVRVHWVGRDRLRAFAKLVGLGNRIRFEYEPFHRELYDSLRFTADEAQRTRDGLDVATLQLSPTVSKLMFALRTWQRMKWANWFGFSRGVARQAAQEVRCSGAVGFLSISSPTMEQFIDGGRALERLWLTATHNRLCFHPTASLPVFLAHERTGCRQLTARHRKLAFQMGEGFYRIFPELEGRAVQMAFRIGYGPPPAVRSLRRQLSSILTCK
jgi:hypothetical protein